MKHRGNRLLRLVDRIIGVPVIWTLGHMSKKQQQPEEIKTILLFGLGAIGDLIISLGSAIPATRRRYPGCQIILIIARSNIQVIDILPKTDVVEVIDLLKIFQSVFKIRKYNGDVLIDFCQWIRLSAIFSYFSRAKFTLGFETFEQYRHFAYDKTIVHSAEMHEHQNFSRLLATIDITILQVPELERNAASTRQIILNRWDRLLIIHPWASGYKHEYREWPVENWRLLISKLVDYKVKIGITGANSDRNKTKDLIDQANIPGDMLINLTGELSLQDVVALITQSIGVVCVNTSIMHIAAALSVPLVAIHGPTNPARWGPLSDKAIVLLPNSKDTSYLNLGWEYPNPTKPCLNLLPVSEVLKATLRSIGLAA